MKSVQWKKTVISVFLIGGLVPHAGAEELIFNSMPVTPVKDAISAERGAVQPASDTTDTSTAFMMEANTLQASETPVSEDGYFKGIESGAVLSGNVFIQINPDSNLRVKKVAYYLNGTQAGREYSAPFTFGGTDGYDTSALKDGKYTLSGAITTYTGDIKFSYSFSVNNSSVSDPEPEPAPEPAPQPSPVENRSSVEVFEKQGAWEYNPVDTVELSRMQGVDVSLDNFDALMDRARQQSGTHSGATFHSLYEPYYMAYQSGPYQAIAISTSERSQFRFGCANGCVEEAADGKPYTIFMFKSPKHPEGIVFEVPHYLKSSTGYGFSPAGELLILGTWTSNKVLVYDQDGKFIATADRAVETSKDPGPAPAAPAPEPEPEPAPVPDSDMIGLTDGATVSGVVQFGPNLQKISGVRKAAYYLNGTFSGRVYEKPFFWGGTSGFDTRTLANGTYTISGFYTTASGDQRFQPITFTVKN